MQARATQLVNLIEDFANIGPKSNLMGVYRLYKDRRENHYMF